MRRTGAVIVLVATAVTTVLAGTAPPSPPDRASGNEWAPIFDGRSLDGWRSNGPDGTFTVEDGAIRASGPFSHLFYSGPVGGHDFRDFELRMEVRTAPGANSGVFFHTAWQPKGLVAQGYEAQINTSDRDPRKTGSLYGIVDVTEAPHADAKWFEYAIAVRGKRITIAVDGETVVDFVEGPDYEPPKNRPKRRLDHGTFALQAHDAQSTVWFRKVRVRVVNPSGGGASGS